MPREERCSSSSSSADDPHQGIALHEDVKKENLETSRLTVTTTTTTGTSRGIRSRTYAKHILSHAESSIPHAWHWRRPARMGTDSCGTVCRSALVLLLLVAIAVGCFTLPIDRMLNGFLIWIHINLGPWGPVALALAYIPLTVFVVPGSILTIGGGYLFGFPIGFFADTIGATFGATVAFLVGRTIGRPLVNAKLKDYPQFQAISLAVERSGFKIVLLLRLVPIVPFNILNYLLSVTPISIRKYMLASWIGMMPITAALVYVGTTIKDLSDISHHWGHFTIFEWILLMVSLVACGVLLVIVSRIARKSLNNAILEIEAESTCPVISAPETRDASEMCQPLMIRVDCPDLTDKKSSRHPSLN